MARIHPLAAVDPGAEIADDVEIGPFVYIESEVVIGAGSKLDSHSSVKSGTTLGRNNYVGQGVVLGGDPQDRKYGGEKTFLQIGDDNVFREYVTVHRATGEGGATVVGNDNFIMAYSHLGHNVVMHNHVTIANAVHIAGHATVNDYVVIGGMAGVHQYVRIGRVSMVGGMGRANVDVPPYMIVEGGSDFGVRDINAVGLRRIGITSESRLALHKACKLLFKSQLSMTNAMEIVRREVPMTPEVQFLLEFEEQRSRGKSGRGNQI